MILLLKKTGLIKSAPAYHSLSRTQENLQKVQSDLTRFRDLSPNQFIKKELLTQQTSGLDFQYEIASYSNQGAIWEQTTGKDREKPSVFVQEGAKWGDREPYTTQLMNDVRHNNERFKVLSV